MINLTLEEKITIFKTLAISKMIHLASVTVLTNFTITRPIKTYKEFIGNHKRPKIKEKTLIKNFDKGSLKDVDIPSIIPLFLIEKYFEKKVQISWFRNTRILLINSAEMKEIFIYHFVLLTIPSQGLWFKKHQNW